MRAGTYELARLNRKEMGLAMRHILIALVVLLRPSSDAWAWGDEGHKVVCELAFRLAKPRTQAEMQRLIKTDTEFKRFSDSCIWPDYPRKRAAEHFVNLARNARGLSANVACPSAQECVLSAIQVELAYLHSSTSTMRRS
jgi:hypothetical protein